MSLQSHWSPFLWVSGGLTDLLSGSCSFSRALSLSVLSTSVSVFAPHVHCCGQWLFFLELLLSLQSWGCVFSLSDCSFSLIKFLGLLYNAFYWTLIWYSQGSRIKMLTAAILLNLLLLLMLGDELAVEKVWQFKYPMLKGQQGQ